MSTKRLSEIVSAFLREVGSIVWVFVAHTLARLVPFAVVVLALVVFGAIISVLLSVLSSFGVSTRLIAATAGVATIGGLWLLGLRLLVGIDLLGPLRRLAGGDGRTETERLLDEVDDHVAELDTTLETFGEKSDRLERTMRAYDDEPTAERERRIGRLLAELREHCRELERLAETIKEKRTDADGYHAGGDIERVRLEAKHRGDALESAIERYEVDAESYVRERARMVDIDADELQGLAVDEWPETSDGSDR
ncbi:hypothetical protein [Natrinema sp. H-ect4]|uniref:hypothetical protein n=1 Tax=Natrinema sp. H-ect4 TaxID=3242699 RepID=UPI0035A85857